MTEHYAAIRAMSMNMVEAASAYVEMGWEPLWLSFMEKRPKGSWKEPRNWTNADIIDAFSGNANIGIALGSRSRNLIDIDFDCSEAAAFGRILLASLAAFGRLSAPASHRVARCDLEKGRYVFQMPDDVAKRLGRTRSMLLEIRGNGQQTVFPPSTHPSGERVQWDDPPSDIPTIKADDLRRMCGLIAFLCLVVFCYPDSAGQRDEICMMLAAVLVRAGLDDETVDLLTEKVAALAGDEEASKRKGKAAAARARLDAGDPVWGLPELCNRLNLQDAEQTLRGWIGQPSLKPVTRGGERPVIFVQGGGLPEEVDQAEAALLKAELGVYQRSESMVRVVRLPASDGRDGVSRPSGALLIHPTTTAWIRENFARTANWCVPTDNGGRAINPPVSHATALLARVGEWKAPVLRGVVSCPTMRADGTILQTPGYDSSSGLLYDPGATEFPVVPEAPSKEAAQAAREVLYTPFREY